MIIGANGRVGRLLTRELIEAGEKPRLMVRDQETARQRFGEQVEIVSGDLNDRASVNSAVKDARAVFVCTPVNPEQVTQHNSIVDAAATSDAYLVKVSGLATFPGSFVDSGRWHAETETYIADSGLRFTCLHPYFFMQNIDFQLEGIREQGILKSALDTAAIAMVDARDIAAVAARLLMDPSIAPGRTLPLTCEQALTYPQMADLMSQVFKREVIFQKQDIAEVEENLSASGQPDWHAKIVLQFNRAFDEGLGATPHPAAADILERPAISFEDYLRTAALNEADSNPFPS